MDSSSSSLISDATAIVKAVGIIVAGLWAAWTFHKLQKPLAAELENRRRLIDVQKARFENEDLRAQLLGHQPNPDFSLEVASVADASSPNPLLTVTVAIANKGTQNFEISFSKSTLTVARLEIADGAQQVTRIQRLAPWLVDEDSDELKHFDSRTFRAGAVRRMVFAVPSSGSGLYLLQFRALYRRIPFDDDNRRNASTGDWVDAIEQTIYSAGAETSVRSRGTSVVPAKLD
jgi:hypothetical protein